LENVATRGEGSAVSLLDINLTVMPGEIVGVAGVSGNGQKELGDVVLGIEQCVSGRKLLNGADATHWSVGQARANRVAFIPENPLAMAVVPWLSIQENAALGEISKYVRHGGLALDWQMVRTTLQAAYGRLGMTPPAFWTPAKSLSGGNLQRFTLAREFALDPQLLVALYPTRGLDVPSTNAAQRSLVAARDAGAGVLLISEDLGELFALSDRLIVLYRGKIVGQFKPGEADMTEIGYLMTGAKVQDGATD
jgi:simple sugar transport system ATP-binding protein